MDGLRALGGSSEFPLTFDDRDIETTAIHITATIDDGVFESKRHILKEAELPDFFRDSRSNATTRSHDSFLKLASVPADTRPGRIYANQAVFAKILQVIGLDPWVEHLIRTLPYGFYHSDNGTVASYFLGTSFVRSVWTCRRDTRSGSFTHSCLILNLAGSWHPSSRSGNYYSNCQNLNGFLEALDIFKEVSHSALYLPFVFAVNALRWREKSMWSVLNLIRRVESRTGHGSWGSGQFVEKRDSIPGLTGELGSALNSVGNATKHLNIIGSIFDHLEELGSRMTTPGGDGRSKSVCASDDSILSAVRILRQQCTNAKEQCTYLEVRIRNQSSVLFAFLTHEDSKINIEIANASKALAKATRRDSSSMKTIAVLTMAFLPATFFAALFSVPSLGWGEPDKFGVYWACTISVTVGTFAVWAGLTQREWLKDKLGRVAGGGKHAGLSEGEAPK